MTFVPWSTRYAYDGEGQRVRKMTCSGGAACTDISPNLVTTYFIYDAFGDLAVEYSSALANRGRQFFTADHLGSTRLITGTSSDPAQFVRRRYDYLPFGEGLGVGVNGRSAKYPVNKRGRVSRESDRWRVGQVHLQRKRCRIRPRLLWPSDMSSAQGRFTSADPNSAGASLFDPQSWNAYSYVNNRPLNHIDPDGDVPLLVITGLGGGLIGGAVSAFSEYRAQQNLSPGERQTGKIWTAFGGGFVAGGLAGLGLGGLAASGVAVGVGTTAVIEGANSVIGGYAQRRTDEALGYSRPHESETLEVIGDAISGGLGGAVGGKLGEKLIPLPNIRKELELLRFANRRSSRAARMEAAQWEFDKRAMANTALGETAENVIFTPFVRSVFDWLFRPQPKVESTFKPCVEGDKREGCQ